MDGDGYCYLQLWGLYPLLVALVAVLVVVVSIAYYKNDTYSTYLGQVGSLKIFLLGDPIIGGTKVHEYCLL